MHTATRVSLRVVPSRRRRSGWFTPRYSATFSPRNWEITVPYLTFRFTITRIVCNCRLRALAASAIVFRLRDRVNCPIDLRAAKESRDNCANAGPAGKLCNYRYSIALLSRGWNSLARYDLSYKSISRTWRYHRGNRERSRFVARFSLTIHLFKSFALQDMCRAEGSIPISKYFIYVIFYICRYIKWFIYC